MKTHVLESGGWSAEFRERGASLIRLRDPEGRDYLTYPPPKDSDFHSYFGSIVGPWGNRIEGSPWGLSANDGKNHLHGGHRGLDLRNWNGLSQADSLLYRYTWQSGDEGYPELHTQAEYSLRSAQISWTLSAEVTRTVPVNLVNHAYWNLGGASADHYELRINSVGVLAPGKDGMVRPPILPPATFGDFSRFFPLAGHLDHTYILPPHPSDELIHAAELRLGPRRMEVWTTAPSIHIYTGDYLPLPRSGICLETGFIPDSPNWKNLPSDHPKPILSPGEIFKTSTVHRFIVEHYR